MKQNGVVCWPGHSLLFFIFRFEYLISGPKSYRDFRETGPRLRGGCKKGNNEYNEDQEIGERSEPRSVCVILCTHPFHQKGAC